MQETKACECLQSKHSCAVAKSKAGVGLGSIGAEQGNEAEDFWKAEAHTYVAGLNMVLAAGYARLGHCAHGHDSVRQYDAQLMLVLLHKVAWSRNLSS